MSGIESTTPVSLNPNLNCLIQNFLYFIRCQGAVAPQMKIQKKSASNLSNVSSPMNPYLTYRKNTHHRLSQINNNISNTIIEGCRGIDTICYKVRQCLDDSQNIGRSRSACNELSWIINETEETKNSGESTEVSLIESVHNETPVINEIAPIKTKIPPPARTEITEISATTKARPTVAKKISLARIKRQVRKRTLILEEFRDTVMDQIEHDDFGAMERIVEHLNEDIENFDRNVTETEKVTVGIEVMLEREMEVVKTQTIDDQESMPLIKLKDNFKATGSEKLPLLIPEVYAKQSVLDLHKKLIAQLEANDSFLCFQRIMERRANDAPRMRQVIAHAPSVTSTVSNRTVADCSSSASCQRRAKRKKKTRKQSGSDSRSAIGSPRRRDGERSVLKLANVRSDLYAKYSDSLWFSERYLGKAKASQRSAQERQKNNPAPKTGSKKEKKHKIKHALRPTPKSSSVSGGFYSDATICLSRCTTSGYSCNLKINNDLSVMPSTKCHLKWIRTRNEQAPCRKIEYLDILDDLTTKDLLPLQSEYPRKDRQGGVKFFSEFQMPAPKYCDDVKSIKESYLYRLLHETNAKPATWDHLLKPGIECSDHDCSICGQRKLKKQMSLQNRAVAQKLLPYMLDPAMNIHFQSVTVMPVRVFYDHDNHLPNRRFSNDANSNALDQKSHPAAMKEAKGLGRAKWAPPNQGSSKSLKVVHATPTKQQSQTKTASRQESNVSTRRTSKSSVQKDCKKLEKYVRVQSDIEKKSLEIQESTPRGLDRKIWANKYGKSIGHQLVRFVKNQPQESKPALPKYALPNVPRVMKNTTRHTQMLAHLKGLKQKNDEIQTNIQKAINVIETKMIDILSAPGDSSSVEAFDLMEKEITNVLSMMKFNSKSNSRNSTPKTAEKTVPKRTDSLEEDFNSISDQLFQKLEKILDSEKSIPTTSASDSDKMLGDEHRKKQKATGPKKGLPEEKYLSSSLTSTSLEDANYRNRHDKNPNKKSRFGRSSIARKPPQNEPLKKEDSTSKQIEREYATGESCAAQEKKSKSLAKLENEGADNSRGDCIEKSCEIVLSGTLLDETIANQIAFQDDTDKENVEDDTDKENFKVTELTPAAPEMIQEEMPLEESDSPSKSDSDTSDPGLSDQVNKIIKRVEDIYSHLDDIQISNEDHVRVFSEPPQLSGVQSQQFLTPFMQAVKEKRSRPVTPAANRQALQRSPSYYNVLTFLDTLSAIQQEKPIEVHTARLCHYCHAYLVPEVFRQTRTEYAALREKAGCLRKHSDEGKSKHKKVSFLVLKENKSCQASICPYHKLKVLKVSSQQFPAQPAGDGEDPSTEIRRSKSQLELQENHVLCNDKTQNTVIHGDHTERTENPVESDQATQVYCQTVTEDPDSSNINPEPEDVQQVSAKSSVSSITDKPRIQVFHDPSDTDIPKLVFDEESFDGFYSHQTILKVKNSALPEFKPKPKIVVFREVSEVTGLLQPLKNMDKFSRASLMEGSGQISSRPLMAINESESGDENVVLLKSFYAFVYILMFTALNLDYRCA